MEIDNNLPKLEGKNPVFPHKGRLKRAKELQYECSEEELDRIRKAEECLDCSDYEVVLLRELRLHPDKELRLPSKVSLKKPIRKGRKELVWYSAIAACILICLLPQIPKEEQKSEKIIQQDYVAYKEKSEKRIQEKEVPTDSIPQINIQVKEKKKIHKDPEKPVNIKEELEKKREERYNYSRLKSPVVLAESITEKEQPIRPIYVYENKGTIANNYTEEKAESLYALAKNFIQRSIGNKKYLSINEKILASQSSEFEIFTGNYDETIVTREFNEKGDLVKTCIYTKPISIRKFTIQ